MRRTETHIWTLSLGLALLLTPSTSRADDFDAENFYPASPGDGALLGVHTAGMPARGQLAFGVLLGMADDPLVADDGDMRVAEVVDDRLAADVGAAYSFGRLEVFAAIPLVLSQTGDENMALGLSGVSRGGVGDVRLGARGLLLGTGYGGLSVAAAVEASAPTGSRPEMSGDATGAVTPRLIVEWRGRRVLVAVNGGARLRRSQTLGDLEVGSAAQVGAGIALAPEGLAGVSLIGEVSGEVGGGDATELPVEARIGLRWTHASGLTLAAAYGRGVTRGYGAPEHRALLSLGFRGARSAPPPPAVAGDTDSDPDSAGAPPVATDSDSAGAPPVAPPSDSDSDRDGIADADDRCPQGAEDVDGFEDDDGCPDADNDSDGIADADDRCPDEPEIINGVDDDDGCPDQGEQLVVVGARRIEVREMIYFATGKDVILPRSAPLLDQLATTLQRNPWIRGVEIGGHTDSRGSDRYNLDLSRRRAGAVRRALVDRGISADRLTWIGYGESQPIDSNRSVRGRAHNRRVEFLITDSDPDHPAARRAAQQGEVQ